MPSPVPMLLWRVMAGMARAQGAYGAPCSCSASASGLVFRGDPSVTVGRTAGARGDAFSDIAAHAEDGAVIPDANTPCN